MAARQAYNTKQRGSVQAVMDEHASEYLSVDEVTELLHARGERVGRTTVYRALERLAAEGAMAKVAGLRGQAAQYRSMTGVDHAGASGQLRCERCGRVLPLDCEMLDSFLHHVEEEHGFAIDRRRTVFTGLCASCRASGVEGAERGAEAIDEGLAAESGAPDCSAVPRPHAVHEPEAGETHA